MKRFPPLKILVAMDRSRTAVEAWAQAREWAERLGSELEALYVEPEPPAGLENGPARETGAERESFEAWFRKEVAGSAPLNVLKGDAARTVADYALAHGFDLIAIGTHGRTGLRRLLEGSVAETVVGRSVVPVLAVRSRRPRVRSILVPLVFKRYALPGLDRAARLGAALGARLHLLQVVARPADIPASRAALRRALKRLTALASEELRPTFEIAAGASVPEIVKAAGRHDLVVLVEHQSPAWAELLRGSTAERVVRGSASPVLAVPSKR